MTRLLILLIAGVILCVANLPSPIVGSSAVELAFIFLTATVAGIFVGILLGAKLTSARASYALLLTVVLCVLSTLFLPGVVTLGVSLFFIFAAVGATFTTHAPGAGILSLLAILGALTISESALRSLPKESFVSAVIAPPPLVPKDWDRGNETYRKMGYRGKRPCKSCPEDLTRIVFIGGSSVAGVPMINSDFAYPSVVDRILKEEVTSRNFEVLNAGIAGYGVMQVLDTLKTEVAKVAPDYVVISTWFNDHSTMLNWYGVQGKSDREAYFYVKMMLFLDAIPGFRALYSSRLAGFYRHYLAILSGRISSISPKAPRSSHRPLQRMNIDEFEWALERICELAKERNFIPVFLYEPTSHAEPYEASVLKHKYYGSIKKVALNHGFPVVDTLAPFAGRSDYGLFLDFIHPNRLGHEVMARAVVDGLQEILGFERSKRVTEVVLKGPKTVKVRAPRSTTSVLLEALGENGKSRVLGEVTAEWKDFTLVPFDQLPLSRLFLSLRIPGETKVGSYSLRTVTHIRASSGGKRSPLSLLEIDGKVIISDRRGYHIAAIDNITAKVMFLRSIDHLASSNGGSRVIAALKEVAALPAGTVVFVITQTDPVQGIDPLQLHQELQNLGGLSTLPAPFDSFLFVGQVGARPGTSLVESGAARVEREFGKRGIEGRIEVDGL